MRLVTKVSETGVESMAMGGEPFHHRFILLKVRYRLDSRRKCLMLDCSFTNFGAKWVNVRSYASPAYLCWLWIWPTVIGMDVHIYAGPARLDRNSLNDADTGSRWDDAAQVET